MTDANLLGIACPGFQTCRQSSGFDKVCREAALCDFNAVFLNSIILYCFHIITDVFGAGLSDPLSFYPHHTEEHINEQNVRRAECAKAVD